MDNKEKKVLEEAKLLLYPTPNCVEYYQTVKATADEVAQRIFEAMSDYVSVVRCKDCRWWKTNYSWNGNEHKICAKEAYEPLRNAEDFCSRGERREDAKTG